MIKYIRLKIDEERAYIEIMRPNWRNVYETNRYSIAPLSASGTRLCRILETYAETALRGQRNDGSLLFMVGWRRHKIGGG